MRSKINMIIKCKTFPSKYSTIVHIPTELILNFQINITTNNENLTYLIKHLATISSTLQLKI